MVVLPGGGDPSRNFESMLLSVMTASALFGIAMDQVSPYSVAFCKVASAYPAQHLRPGQSLVELRKGGQEEGEDTYTPLVSWLIAAGGFVHAAMISRHASLSFHNLCASEEYTTASDISAGNVTAPGDISAGDATATSQRATPTAATAVTARGAALASPPAAASAESARPAEAALDFCWCC